MAPKAETLANSISVSEDHAKKLLDDAILLFDRDRYSTALAIGVLAQEEFAKAFLLQLVADGALPWLPAVQRSIVRHQCKHLLALVMDWLPPFDIKDALEQGRRNTAGHEQWMAWSKRRIDNYKQGILKPDPNDPEPQEPEITLSPDVADALNIYRHEEIERMRGGNPWRDEYWAKGKAHKIADGALDRKKQSALYVNFQDGQGGVAPAGPQLCAADSPSAAVPAAAWSRDKSSVPVQLNCRP